MVFFFDDPAATDIYTFGHTLSLRDARPICGAGDVAVGDHLVLYADGSYLKTGDLRIGGHALSPAARAAALASSQLPPEAGDDGEEPIDFAANAAIQGPLPNSAAEIGRASCRDSVC